MTAAAASADLETVVRALPAVLRDRYGAGARLVAVEPQQHPYSTIGRLVADCDGAHLPLFVKRPNPPKRTPGQVRRALLDEAHILQRLGEAMPGRAAELVAVFPDEIALVTLGCRGVQFDRALGRHFWTLWGSRNRARFGACSRACGSWLRGFHQTRFELAGTAEDWREFWLGQAEWRVRKLADLDRGHAELYRACLRRFEAELVRFPGEEPLPVTHGDFAPHNIFVADDGSVQVFDFFAARRAPAATDIIIYLTKIAAYAETIAFPAGAARDLGRAFLAGYGTLNGIDRVLLRLLGVAQAIKRALALHGGTEPWTAMKRYALARWYVPYLRQFLAQPLTEMKSDLPWPFLALPDPPAGQARPASGT